MTVSSINDRIRYTVGMIYEIFQFQNYTFCDVAVCQ